MENLDWHAGGGKQRAIAKGCLITVLVLFALFAIGTIIGVLSDTHHAVKR
jgi:hypothetical protein